VWCLSAEYPSLHTALERSFRQVFIVDFKINIHSAVNYHTLGFELLRQPIDTRPAAKNLSIKFRR
jgi:hypothetical protein